MVWVQRQIRLPAVRRGLRMITSDVVRALPELADLRCGVLHVFLQHTSAALTLNENADPAVQVDLSTTLDTLVPESLPYTHTIEGPDDMPAHVKSSLLGSSLSIPVQDGRLALGTWQGVYLCECRDRAAGRNVMLTLNGE